MYIYLAETNGLHLLQSLVYEPDTTSLIVNKDISIECETVEAAKSLYEGIIDTVEDKKHSIVSVFPKGKYNKGYYREYVETPDTPF